MADDARTPSLMKKTKSQLVDIILRKDDVHKRLIDEKEKLVADYENLQNNFKLITEDRDALQLRVCELIDNIQEGAAACDAKNLTISQLTEVNKNLEERCNSLESFNEDLKEHTDELTCIVKDRDDLISTLNREYSDFKTNTYPKVILVSIVVSFVIGFTLGYVF